MKIHESCMHCQCHFQQRGQSLAMAATFKCWMSLKAGCAGACRYFFFGWAFAYGDKLDADGNSINNAFIGTSNFAMSTTDESKYNTYLFQYVVRSVPAAFAATFVWMDTSSQSEAPSPVTEGIIVAVVRQMFIMCSLLSRPPRLCLEPWPSASSSSPMLCTPSS